MEENKSVITNVSYTLFNHNTYYIVPLMEPRSLFRIVRPHLTFAINNEGATIL